MLRGTVSYGVHICSGVDGEKGADCRMVGHGCSEEMGVIKEASYFIP